MIQHIVKFIVKEGFSLPDYGSVLASGADVRADLNGEDSYTLQPMERKLFNVGLKVAYIPAGFEIQVRPKSGRALKEGLTILNSPGTIDADYRGDVGAILINLSNKNIVIEHGQKIAQLVLCPVNKMYCQEVSLVDDTERGTGGFGSTGL